MQKIRSYLKKNPQPLKKKKKIPLKKKPQTLIQKGEGELCQDHKKQHAGLEKVSKVSVASCERVCARARWQEAKRVVC